MQKEAMQTDGQKLLRQLREEYRRLEKEDPPLTPEESESCDSGPWLVLASGFVN